MQAAVQRATLAATHYADKALRSLPRVAAPDVSPTAHLNRRRTNIVDLLTDASAQVCEVRAALRNPTVAQLGTAARVAAECYFLYQGAKMLGRCSVTPLPRA